MQSTIKYEFNEHLKASKKTMETVGESIEIAAVLCIDSLKKGNKVNLEFDILGKYLAKMALNYK